MAKTFIRFTNVTIPNASTIQGAFVEFTAYTGFSTSGVTTTLYFVDADDPDSPTDETELEAFSLTSGVSWSGLTSWEIGESYYTPDLKSILQTVIDRSGWASGNALILIIDGSASPSYISRRASSYDYASAVQKPALNVSWYSDVVSKIDNTKWQVKQIDEGTAIETSWAGSDTWNMNIYASAGGGSLSVRGNWYLGYRPGGMAITHDALAECGSNPHLKLFASDGILYEHNNYVSGTEFEPNWTGRIGDISYFQLLLAGAADPFHVTGITFDSTPATGQTSTSTTSTISTTSSTSSTISTTSSTSSTASTSSMSTTTSSSSTSSTASSTSSSSSTASTASTLSTTSSTSPP